MNTPGDKILMYSSSEDKIKNVKIFKWQYISPNLCH
jgi:hypothetical protein